MMSSSLASWFRRTPASVDTKSLQAPPAEIEAFEADPDNPFLVSFPRTGSHWLRMLMELYFERPSLVRVFYLHDRRDYLTRHVHDIDLDVERTNVIYLYRDPAPTVFSQLTYHGQAVDDLAAIDHWSGLYGRHLAKWLLHEEMTRQKTILRYERLKTDIGSEFARLCAHLALPFDADRITAAAAQVTKGEVESRTGHDPNVIARQPDYADKRGRFLAGQGQRIRDRVLDADPALEHHLTAID